MKVFFTSLFVLAASTQFSFAGECYVNQPRSGLPVCAATSAEARAFQEAVGKGLRNDINELTTRYGTCHLDSPRVMRVGDVSGNHGKDIYLMVLTNVACERAQSQFPVFVSMWSSLDEKEFGNVEVDLLYKKISI